MRVHTVLEHLGFGIAKVATEVDLRITIREGAWPKHRSIILASTLQAPPGVSIQAEIDPAYWVVR